MRGVWLGAAVMLMPVAALGQTTPVALPTVEVVGTSPVAGSGIDRDKVPANVQTLGAGDFDYARSPSLLITIAPCAAAPCARACASY